MQLSWMTLLRAVPIIGLAFVLWFFFIRDNIETTPSNENAMAVTLSETTDSQAAAIDTGTLDATTILRRKLHLAEAANRLDLLDHALAQLEAISPSHPDVKFYRGYRLIADQRFDDADAVLRDMQKHDPQSKQTQYFQQYLRAMTEQKELLSHAQLLATAGRREEAVTLFKELFPNGMPTLGLQLRVMDIEGHIPERWASIRNSLERLNKEYQGFPLIELMLAEHLSRRSLQDPQAVEIFQRLAIGPGLGRRAAASWLLILGERPIDASVLRDYATLASRYPTDISIQDSYRHAAERLATERQQLKDPYYRARKQGLAALDAQRNTQAETELLYALKGRPDDEQVLGGLGVLYLRTGNSAAAERYFQLALQHNQNPDWIGKWTRLIDTAHFWKLLKQIDQLLELEQFHQAESTLAEAQALRPNSVHVHIATADVAKAQKQYARAETAYQYALKLSPQNGQALRGILALRELRSGRHAALRLAAEFSPAQQQTVSPQVKALKQQIAQAQVDFAKRSGDPDQILEAVEQALALQPISPWQRADLAKELLKLGQAQRADQLMADWQQTTPSAEMTFAYALYLSFREQGLAAVEQLRSIPPQQRSEAMQQNLLRLELDLALRGIDIDNPNVQTKLNTLTKHYSNDDDARIRLAKAWLELDQKPRALTIYHALKPSQDWPLARQLAYGNLMLSLEQLNDFSVWYSGRNLRAASPQAQQQFALLNTRYQLTRAKQAEQDEHHMLAYSLYHRAAQSLGPDYIAAKLGLLRSSAAINERAIFQQQAANLLTISADLTPAESMQLLTILSDNNDRESEHQLITQLRERDDMSAMQIRKAMLLSAKESQSELTEALAYNVLLRASAKPPATPLNKQSQKKQLYQSAPDNWLTRSARQQIDTLRDRNDGHVTFGLDFKKRAGRDQASQVPVEVKWPVPSLDGHIIARADFVKVDSGTVNYLDPQSGSLNRIPFSSTADGIALGLGWLSDRWWADIGTTPLGFQNSNIVGGAGISGKLATVGWNLAVSRRPELGTTLSYVGMEVPATANNAGTEWGGVVRSGAKLGLSIDRGGAYGYWASLQYHLMTGENVADNTRLGILGGVYHRVIDQEDRKFRVGLNLLHFQYGKNLSEYTLQHGAYFSPQNYLSLSIPVRYYGRVNDDWSYLIGASVSRSWSREDAPYLLGGNSSSGGGAGYAAEAAVEKRISKRWYLGLAADVQRADFYEPNHIMLYAKYTLEDRWQAIWTPPEPPILYSNFD
ncbi:MAG: cellulose synthase subunit BcsC-related outer membrane protein [Zhongshania sp.]|uniref:cellulose synthase subunit BcsC-related outer membrane protein n=1 Tax=Zhongshania sp. TaxID=1971902 RepID=UPI0026304F16|nr:cellulose synthase subunit BcsC-related outer membrane protein [Zhongshania sp.]MDF1693782.1 cellulose synthase subunit BcsC-related outer membrane protein [Zhongshania sp.]